MCTAAFGVNKGLKSQQRPCSAVPGMQETSADVKGVDAEEWKCFCPSGLSKTEHSELNHSNVPSKGKQKNKKKNPTPKGGFLSSPVCNSPPLSPQPHPPPPLQDLKTNQNYSKCLMLLRSRHSAKYRRDSISFFFNPEK